MGIVDEFPTMLEDAPLGREVTHFVAGDGKKKVCTPSQEMGGEAKALNCLGKGRQPHLPKEVEESKHKGEDSVARLSTS